ncbi:MAG: bifunctional glycosyltransferase family 2/GtrA family protein [Candidatus Sulfopaludibacter sp.]|nr:bifunctional glycosyltransferase family 2/GtrA family protein [Candidatus Sulfopaludibacter sp.]
MSSAPSRSLSPGGGTAEGAGQAAAALPVVLIPAYRPTEALPRLAAELVASARVRAVVVVDDGSGSGFAGIFAAAAKIEGVHVLTHLVNLGKGAALKTGLNYAALSFPECTGVVTADADGQHTAKDIVRTAGALVESPQDLILGARSFPPQVPFRSRLGNILTRYVLRAVVGQAVSDTQTGLRGVPMDLIPTLLRLRPNGYDFELEVLLACRRTMRDIREIPIETIYLDGNRSSHFNPLLDSMRIYFLFLRFGAVSLSSALLDNLVFLLAFHVFGSILPSQAVGRAISGSFNYYMNKTNVFHARVRDTRAMPKYWGFVVAFGAAGYGLIRLLTSVGFSVLAAKLSAETLLFGLSFVAQREIIFTQGKTRGS